MPLTTIIEKLTSHCKNALSHSFYIAQNANKNLIEIDDVFWGLLYEQGSLASDVLTKDNLTLKKSPNEKIKIKTLPLFELPDLKNKFSEPVKKIILKSTLLAYNYGHKYVGTEHLLYSILNNKNETIIKILATYQLKAEPIIKHLETILDSTSHFPDMTDAVRQIKNKLDKKTKKQKNNDHRQSLLELFATCLTDEENQKKITPVIGRENEIKRVIQILARKNKNNPLLIGEPGVGKTAIIEGLASQISSNSVPDILINKKIYALDISLIVAGTTYRGDFEARIKQIIEEIKNDPSIIIFIDEIHNIVGAGSASGSLDAANILKPALARGEIKCIGATTYEDYKKFIEPDTALVRRFQTVKVLEPSPQEAINILYGLKQSFEKHHGINITASAINEAVNLSVRYLPEQFLPDKAIDLIDEALAQKKISLPGSPYLKKMIGLEQELSTILKKKNDLITAEKYENAIIVKTKELELIQKIYALKNSTANTIEASSEKINITAEDIKNIVSASTHIEIPNIENIHPTLLNLENVLNEKIIGQKKVILELTNTLKRSAVGLAGETRPLGSFIFMGPSGVGKTHTAKILAETFFHDQNNLVRLDMSEFAEKFNSSKILGAPAGYVGYGEGGVLTEKIKRNPYSVILLDEIEKAHPEIFNIFLQILEDGQLSDARGKNINFRNTIIIMTTNIGTKQLGEKQNIGFAEKKDADEIEDKWWYESLNNFLKPEFINRLDKVLVFKKLGRQEIKKIIELNLLQIAKKLKKQNLTVNITPKIIDFIAANSNEEEGARAIRRTIQDKIENPLADFILNKKNNNDNITIMIKQKKIIIS